MDTKNKHGFKNDGSWIHIPLLKEISDKLDILLDKRKQAYDHEIYQFMPKDEFLKHFKIKSGMLYQMINNEEINVYRIKRKMYFHKGEMVEALKNGTIVLDGLEE